MTRSYSGSVLAVLGLLALACGGSDGSAATDGGAGSSAAGSSAAGSSAAGSSAAGSSAAGSSAAGSSAAGSSAAGSSAAGSSAAGSSAAGSSAAGSSAAGSAGAAGQMVGGIDDPPTDTTPDPLPSDLASDLLSPPLVTGTLTWKPEVKQLDAAKVKAALQNPIPGFEPFAFTTAELPEVGSLQGDDVVFLPGVGVFKVSFTDTIDDKTFVYTTPVPLDEAVAAADLTWDLPIPESAVDLDGDVAPPGSMTKPAGLPKPSIAWTGMLDDFKVAYEAGTTPGYHQLRLDGEKLAMGEQKSKFFTVAYVSRFRTVGQIKIEGGSLVSASFGIKDAMLDATVKFGSAKGSLKKDFEMPPFITIPFTAGGLPLFLTVGTTVSFEVAADVQSSLIGEARLKARAHGGFKLSSTTTSTADFKIDSHALTFKGGNYASTVEIGGSLFVGMPKIAFGVGLPSLQDNAPEWLRPHLNALWRQAGLPPAYLTRNAVLAALYVRFGGELVQNVKVKIGPAGELQATCADVGVGFGIFYGGEGAVFKSKLSQLLKLSDYVAETQLGGEVMPTKYGPGCPAFGM